MNMLDKCVEFMKYDYNEKKMGLVILVQLVIKTLALFNRHTSAFRLTSILFRTGWAGSEKVGLAIATDYFITRPRIGKKIAEAYINGQQPLEHTAKFFTDPSEMLDGIITVIKAPVILKQASSASTDLPPTIIEKGAILIKYSYYFPLLIRYFAVDELSEQYNIILEPSWAGFCEENILIFTQFNFPIFVQVYEERDKAFINQLQCNLIPIPVGPSWFIDHTRFVANNAPVADTENANQPVRDIDIIIVAAWAKYKRHEAVFQALAKHQSQNAQHPQKLNIVCVGYPGDLSKEDIMDFARQADIADQVTLYEWIEPAEVAALLRRSKVNLLWSKFEGNNRAIIEGMFCDTPVILREGHNYGEHYDFINSQTGHFANETTLYSTIMKIIDNFDHYQPRQYVLENRNCINATRIMSQYIKATEIKHNRPWTKDLTVKVNNLHGMSYLEPPSQAITHCYTQLTRYIKS